MTNGSTFGPSTLGRARFAMVNTGPVKMKEAGEPMLTCLSWGERRLDKT